MPNFQEFARETQKQSILEEIETRKRKGGDDFNWQSFFVNFHHYLPHGLHYEEYIKEKDQSKKFGETNKTLREYLADLNSAIKENGIGFETAYSIREQASNIYRRCVKLITEGKGESEEAKRLKEEHEILHSKFYETILPIYLALRMKGYLHKDIVT